jgi:hypothetical protein
VDYVETRFRHLPALNARFPVVERQLSSDLEFRFGSTAGVQRF